MIFGKLFQKRKEDFVCESCGTKVKGNGYTNHCPHCLWSKHVDINPGDRLSTCQGMMKPTAIEIKKGDYYLKHVCLSCGHQKNNKVSIDDDFDQMIEVIKRR